MLVFSWTLAFRIFERSGNAVIQITAHIINSTVNRNIALIDSFIFIAVKNYISNILPKKVNIYDICKLKSEFNYKNSYI